jgi:hypothetical protein
MAFTSSLDCQQDFLEWLARFASRRVFVYWDAREGLVSRDFGDILWEYSQTCARGTEVSYERTTQEDSVHLQNRAGLLGVFGNLMTCTVAHGIIVRYFADEDDEINVAGDDGLAPEDDEDELALDLLLTSIGEYERTKTFRSDQPGAIHLKRPFSTIDNLVNTKPSLAFPSVSRIMYLYDRDKFEDPRFRFLMETEDEYFSTRHSRVGRDLLRYLRTVHFERAVVAEDEIDKVLSFAREVTRLFGMCLSGRIPITSSDGFWPLIPQSERLFDEDPAYSLISENYNGLCIVPRLDNMDYVGDYKHYSSEVITCNGNRHLTWLCHLGIAKKRIELEVCEGVEGFRRLYGIFRPKDPVLKPLYTFTFLRDVPFWLQCPQ